MRPRNLFILLVLTCVGLFVFLQPREARSIWNRLNATISGVLGADKGEYEQAKAYFYVDNILIRSFVTADLLVLTDGSRWRVREPKTVVHWSIGQTIKVENAKDSKFPYFLVNEDTRARVNARYLGKE